MDAPAPTVEKWVWKLFTGDAYPYIRRTLQHQKGAPPMADEIKTKFFEVYTHSVVKVMVMELVGLGLEFQDLAAHAYGEEPFIRLMADPIGDLGRNFGGGKYKLSFYYGEQFVATQNFKVAGQPRWNSRKFLLSVLDAMEQKARSARPPDGQAQPAPASFQELLGYVGAIGGLSAERIGADNATFLAFIRQTAGNQYEDYFQLLMRGAEDHQLAGYFIQQLNALSQRRSAV